MNNYIKILKDYSYKTYKQVTRKPKGCLAYPYLVPGSDSYQDDLWDWDSWLTDIAARQIMQDNKDVDETFVSCEKGCVLNFLAHIKEDGRIPIVITPKSSSLWLERNGNIHKPCLAQHAAFITKSEKGDASWLKEDIDKLMRFVDYYIEHCRHEDTGLYFWIDDLAIGVDNDPCTYYRPQRSSASIYLNCFMYKELVALAYLLAQLGRDANVYTAEAEHLKDSINQYLWDERNGFYYSADINLRAIDPSDWLHKGAPRNWSSILQKTDVWSGFLAMWAGLADEERAKAMVEKNMLDTRTFCAPYGIRSLAKTEQMYQLEKTGNPSCWLGPVWTIANWVCFEGLLNYGYRDEAVKLSEKTILLLGKDVESTGCMHEYYHPETGEGMNNPGFQNWNLLVNNMIAHLEGKPRVVAF